MSKRISDYKETGRLIGKQKSGKTDMVIDEICDNFLISKELITKGEGGVFIVNEDILNRYMKDTAFHDRIWDKEKRLAGGTNERRSKEKYDYFAVGTTRAILNDYAKYIGETWDSIVEAKYAYLNYYGGLLLNPTQAVAVSNLIDTLYFLQTEREQIYDRILKIAQQDIQRNFNTFVALEELRKIDHSPHSTTPT